MPVRIFISLAKSSNVSNARYLLFILIILKKLSKTEGWLLRWIIFIRFYMTWSSVVENRHHSRYLRRSHWKCWRNKIWMMQTKNTELAHRRPTVKIREPSSQGDSVSTGPPSAWWWGKCISYLVDQHKRMRSYHLNCWTTRAWWAAQGQIQIKNKKKERLILPIEKKLGTFPFLFFQNICFRQLAISLLCWKCV